MATPATKEEIEMENRGFYKKFRTYEKKICGRIITMYVMDCYEFKKQREYNRSVMDLHPVFHNIDMIDPGKMISWYKDKSLDAPPLWSNGVTKTENNDIINISVADMSELWKTYEMPDGETRPSDVIYMGKRMNDICPTATKIINGKKTKGWWNVNTGRIVYGLVLDSP